MMSGAVQSLLLGALSSRVHANIDNIDVLNKIKKYFHISADPVACIEPPIPSIGAAVYLQQLICRVCLWLFASSSQYNRDESQAAKHAHTNN